MRLPHIPDLAARFPSTALLRRESLRMLRRVRFFVGLVLLTALMTWLVVGFLPRHLQATPAQIVESSSVMILTMLMLWMATALLGIPAYAGASIVGEREGDTFTLVHMTLISPTGWVAASILNSLGMFLIFLCATFPIGAASLFLIGFDWNILILAGAVILATALTASCAGVLCSAMRSNVRHAMSSAYGLTFVLIVGPALVSLLAYTYFTYRYPDGNHQHFLDLSSFLCPVYTVWALFMQRFGLQEAVLAISVQGIFASILFLLAAWRVRRRVHIEYRKERRRAAAIRLAARTLAPFVRTGPAGFHPMSNRANPIYVKELRWDGIAVPMTRFRVMASALIGGAFIALLLLFFLTERQSQEAIVFRAFLGIQMAVGCYVACSICGSALTRDRETGNLDALRLTLLAPGSVVLGKALAGMRVVVPYMGGMSLGGLILLPLALRDPNGLVLAAMAAVSTVLCVWASVCLALLASSLCKRPGPATALAIILAFITLVLGPVFLNKGHAGDALFFSPLLGTIKSLFEYGELRADRVWYWAVTVLVSSLWPLGVLTVTTTRWAMTWEAERQWTE